jgi:hypothetical protein
MPDARVILPPSTTHDAVDEALHDLGCLLVNAIPRTEELPAQFILLTADRRHFIHVIEDPRLDALAIVVRGECAETQAGTIRGRLEARAEADATPAREA